MNLRIAGASLCAFYFLHCAATPTKWHFIDNVNLIFHEAGHTIFFVFGEFISICMGSGFQVFLPFSIAVYFFYTKQSFAGTVTLMWVGENLITVSVYAGDALLQQLALLGGDSVIHDWNYILSTLGVLQYTSQIAQAIFLLGVCTILLGILHTALAIYRECVLRSRLASS